MELKNFKIEHYLNETCTFIKNKSVHIQVKKEISSHIFDLVKYYENKGYSESDAIDLSLKDIGDTKKLGEDLNSIHKKHVDFKLIFTLLFLMLVGFLGTITFNNLAAYQKNPSLSSLYLYKDIRFLIIAFILFFIGFKLNFLKLKKLSIPLYIFSYLLYAEFGLPFYLNTYFIGKTYLSGFNFNYFFPLIPFFFILSLCGIYTKFRFKTLTSNIIAIILGLLPLILLAYCTKYTPFVLYYSISLIILLYLNSKNVKLTIITSFISVLIFISTSLIPLINMFKSSIWSYSLINKILTTSKLIGRNPIISEPYINESYPITSSIGYFGWIFGILLILVLLFILYKLFKASYSIKNTYFKSIAFSISIILSIDTIISILINLNLFPYIGLQTPFLSFSGLAFLTMALMMGIISNLYRLKTVS